MYDFILNDECYIHDGSDLISLVLNLTEWPTFTVGLEDFNFLISSYPSFSIIKFYS